MGRRTPIGKFIHTKWTAMNMRCGKWKHLNVKNNRNKYYDHITIEFTQPEFKNWCLEREQQILSLNRPSIDRIDSKINYTLNNIQVIELTENIRKKKFGNEYVDGPKSNIKRGVRRFKGKFQARIQINKKQIYLGRFENIEDAYNAFRNAYINHYGKEPWSTGK